MHGSLGAIEIIKDKEVKYREPSNTILASPDEIVFLLSNCFNGDYYLDCIECSKEFGIVRLKPFNKFIHISGYPGTGKTTLINKFKETYANNKEIIIFDTDDVNKEHNGDIQKNIQYMLNLKDKIVIMCGITFAERSSPRYFCKHKYYIRKDYKEQYIQLQKRTLSRIKDNLALLEEGLDKGKIDFPECEIFEPFLIPMHVYEEGNKKLEYIHNDYLMMDNDKVFTEVTKLVSSLL
jgi:hypothetical protein